MATLNYTIGLAQGSYIIHALFTSDSPFFLSSSADNTLTVSSENPVVTARSSNPLAVKVNTAGGTAGPITLCTDITEVADGSAGNIANAVPVTFTVAPVSGGATITQIATVTGGGVGGTLAACVTLSSVPVNVYDITIRVGGNYYTGSAETSLVVYDLSLGCATGGGKLTHNGVPANFGFSAKYLKNGQTQGSLLYIAHRHFPDLDRARLGIEIQRHSDTDSVGAGRQADCNFPAQPNAFEQKPSDDFGRQASLPTG